MSIHVNYEKMSDVKREMVDECFQGLFDHLSDFGYPCANDDRAEVLVEAIATYIAESARR
jgi:hypothetical protein